MRWVNKMHYLDDEDSEQKRGRLNLPLFYFWSIIICALYVIIPIFLQNAIMAD